MLQVKLFHCVNLISIHIVLTASALKRFYEVKFYSTYKFLLDCIN